MLPTSRNTTYAPLSQLKSADLNALQDCLVDLNKFLTAQAQATWASGIALAANEHVVVSGSGRFKRGDGYRKFPACGWTGANFTQGAGFITLNTGAVVYAPLIVHDGERLKQVGIRATDSGAATIDLKVIKVDTSAGLAYTQLGATASSVGSGGANQDVTVGGLTEVAGGLDAITYLAEISLVGAAVSETVRGMYLITDVP